MRDVYRHFREDEKLILFEEDSFCVKPYVEPSFLTIVSGDIVLTAENGMYACPNCFYEIDSCQCACPYCAESESCDCAIGHDKATGG